MTVGNRNKYLFVGVNTCNTESFTFNFFSSAVDSSDFTLTQCVQSCQRPLSVDISRIKGYINADAPEEKKV